MLDLTLQNGNEVILSGRFDASQTDKAENFFDQINSDCSVDFSGLAYISSAGLGTLLKLYTRLKGSGYVIKLTNMNKHVREVFKYSKLDEVFTIVE